MSLHVSLRPQLPDRVAPEMAVSGPEQAGRDLKKSTMGLGGSDAFIVVEELADRFLEKFKAALSALAPGDPMDKATTLGPRSSEKVLVKLLKQVDQAVANGAKVVLGGSIFTRDAARGRRIASRIDTGMVFINHPTWTAPELPFGGTWIPAVAASFPAWASRNS